MLLKCFWHSLRWHWKINIHNVVSRTLQKHNYFWSIMVVSQRQSNFCRCKFVFMSFMFVAIDEIVQTCGQPDCLWCHPLCSYEWAQIFWILFSVDDWLFCWATSTPILGLAVSSCSICLHHEFFPPPAFKCWPIQLGFGRGSCKVFSTWHIHKLQKLFSWVSGSISGYLMEALSAVSYWKKWKTWKQHCKDQTVKPSSDIVFWTIFAVKMFVHLVISCFARFLNKAFKKAGMFPSVFQFGSVVKWITREHFYKGTAVRGWACMCCELWGHMHVFFFE